MLRKAGSLARGLLSGRRRGKDQRPTPAEEETSMAIAKARTTAWQPIAIMRASLARMAMPGKAHGGASPVLPEGAHRAQPDRGAEGDRRSGAPGAEGAPRSRSCPQ